MLVPQQSSWPAQRADSRFHFQWPHDVHAMSIRLRSYSSHPEGKRALCLGGITRTFFAHGFRVRSTVPIERRGGFLVGTATSKRSFRASPVKETANGDGTFFPTNLERHSWLYPGFAANVFWNYQSPGMINGGFHGIENTIF